MTPIALESMTVLQDVDFVWIRTVWLILEKKSKHEWPPLNPVSGAYKQIVRKHTNENIRISHQFTKTLKLCYCILYVWNNECFRFHISGSQHFLLISLWLPQRLLFIEGSIIFYRGPSSHSLTLPLFILALLAVNTLQEPLLSLPFSGRPRNSIPAGSKSQPKGSVCMCVSL